MKVTNKKTTEDKTVKHIITTKHTLPNGALVLLDSNNKMVAYKKVNKIDRNWDWVRKNSRFIA